MPDRPLSSAPPSDVETLRAEMHAMRHELQEAQAIIGALRAGEVDALVVGAPRHERVYTLLGSDHPYRMLVEAMREGAVTLARNGTVLYGNPSFIRMMRTTPQELIGVPFTRFIHADDASRFEAFLNHGDTGKDELTLEAADGTPVPAYLSRSAADLMGVQGICLVVTDLTEQKKHDEVVNSERLARSILEQAAEAMLVCDPAGRITHASRQAEVLYGENPLWKPLEEAFPLREATPGGAALMPRLFEAALAGHATVGQEATFSPPDGPPCHLQVSGAPLYNEEGSVLGVVLVMTDVSAQRRAVAALEAREREMRQLNATLEDRVAQRTADLSRANLALQNKNRELQDFAYVASHDLQEPLRKISAFADLIDADCQDQLNDDGHQYLDRMRQAALRMADLLRDLLSFSRVTTHGQAFALVDLNEVLDTVCSDLDLTLSETGGSVKAEPLPPLEADPVQMRQLLHHLVSNALKFHHPQRAPQVQVRSEIVRGEVTTGDGYQTAYRFEIEDNGIGFDEKYVDRIFTPFQRLHGRQAYAGTGMGLAICRRIVERHQGTITARSRIDEGTTFIVTLPAAGLQA